MVDLSERDAALLLDMLLAARNAQNFVHGLDFDAFSASQLHQSATIRAIEIIGEAANRISPDTQARISAIPWREVIGMRHKLIHGYSDIQLDLVWTTVTKDIPALLEVLERIVPEDGSAQGKING